MNQVATEQDEVWQWAATLNENPYKGRGSGVVSRSPGFLRHEAQHEALDRELEARRTAAGRGIQVVGPM